MSKRIIYFLLLATVLSSCGNNQPKSLPPNEESSFISLGDSISKEAQNLLLQNVAAAIQKGGTDYAIEFCNINAMSITDSLARKHQTIIQRLSDKNRNADNGLTTQADSSAWLKIKNEKTAFVEHHKNGEVYYYKPILIGMPTCLKCHGSSADIAESTQKLIHEKYPNDKAIGYSIGNLRGMWKIKIK